MAQKKRENAAFILFPHAASAEQVLGYSKALREGCLTARQLLSIPRDRQDILEKPLLKEFDFFSCGGTGDRLIARAMPPLLDLAYRDVDIVYFVTAMLRYSPKDVLEFVKKCEETQSGILLLGKPPVLQPNGNSKIEEALEIEKIIKNLMVDVFTSYIVCLTNPMIYGSFMNLTAGVFAFRMRSATIGNTLREMLSVMPYRDSDLLPLSIALSMGANLSVRTIDLSSINLEPFTGGLSRRIDDLRFILDKLTKQSCISATPKELMASVFDDLQFKKIFRDDYREWFKTKVLGLAPSEEGRRPNVIKGDPLRSLPKPDLKK